MNLEFSGDERDILLVALDLYQQSLWEIGERAKAVDDWDDIPDLEAKRQEIVDLASRIRTETKVSWSEFQKFVMGVNDETATS